MMARFTALAGELRVRVAAHAGDGTLEIVTADEAARAAKCCPLRQRQVQRPVGYAIDMLYRCRWRR